MERKAILFTNHTAKDFSWDWNSTTYTFKAGESMLLEDYLAKHFAKHLADREFEGREIVGGALHNQMMAKFLSNPEEEIKGEDETQVKQKIIDKRSNMKKKKKKEVEFEGLKK